MIEGLVPDASVAVLYKGADAFESVNVGFYPGGEPMINQGPIPGYGRRVNDPALMVLRPESIAQFMAAMWWVDALVERGFKVPSLALPYIPGARQDRLNPTGDYLFTAKSIAREINMRNFPRVTVFDPHSEVAPALIDRCRVVHADSVFSMAGVSSEINLGTDRRCQVQGRPSVIWSGVIAPDAGAEKRAGAVAKKLGLPLFHAWKTRSVTDGSITGFGMQDLTPHDGPFSFDGGTVGASYLVVDDICDGGGTFEGLAGVAPKMVKLDLYVSHGIFSKGTADLKKHFRTIYTTNSLLGNKPGVEVIDVTPNLLQGA